MENFLDRLMMAESGGRLRRKNPRSTALGPFQFIDSTFLFVVNKHFQSEVAGLAERQVLARRTDMAFSRRVARAYVHDLIAALSRNGLPASPVNVRIAFLVGPSAAIRLLGARPDRPLATVLSTDAITANPFMTGATVAQLIQRAALEVGATAEPGGLAKSEPAVEPAPSADAPTSTLVVLEAEPPGSPVAPKGEAVGTAIDPRDEPTATTSAGPSIRTRCQTGLASCRRWIALQERKGADSMRSDEP
jgi:hypothetical protein